MSDLKSFIRNVPDYPKPGIGFKDITTLLIDGPAFREAVDLLAERFQNQEIKKVVGIESRGFVFGSVIAYKWGVGFVPVRKPGKLPAETISEDYDLEYGTDSLEIHRDAITPGEKVLIVDDLLATGGTAQATVNLINRLGGEIAGIAFLIELSFLNGRQKLNGNDVLSLMEYDAE